MAKKSKEKLVAGKTTLPINKPFATFPKLDFGSESRKNDALSFMGPSTCFEMRRISTLYYFVAN
jgi:hypothetical protein